MRGSSGPQEDALTALKACLTGSCRGCAASGLFTSAETESLENEGAAVAFVNPLTERSDLSPAWKDAGQGAA